MLFFIIFGIMLCVGIFLLVLYYPLDYDSDLICHIGWAFAIIGFIVIGFALFSLPNSKQSERSLNQKIAEVNIYMDSEKEIRSLNEYNTVFSFIVGINKTIQEHKAFIDSPWRGIFLSKNIAEMEPYPYDGLKNPSETKNIIFTEYTNE
jgi:hypothetical protein